MEIQGHFQKGMIVPHDGVALPDGTEVTIVISPPQRASGQVMTDEERSLYLAALARIDAVPDENPGDGFSGTDHDRVLYGDGA